MIFGAPAVIAGAFLIVAGALDSRFRAPPVIFGAPLLIAVWPASAMRGDDRGFYRLVLAAWDNVTVVGFGRLSRDHIFPIHFVCDKCGDAIDRVIGAGLGWASHNFSGVVL